MWPQKWYASASPGATSEPAVRAPATPSRAPTRDPRARKPRRGRRLDQRAAAPARGEHRLELARRVERALGQHRAVGVERDRERAAGHVGGRPGVGVARPRRTSAAPRSGARRARRPRARARGTCPQPSEVNTREADAGPARAVHRARCGRRPPGPRARPRARRAGRRSRSIPTSRASASTTTPSATSPSSAATSPIASQPSVVGSPRRAAAAPRTRRPARRAGQPRRARRVRARRSTRTARRRGRAISATTCAPRTPGQAARRPARGGLDAGGDADAEPSLDARSAPPRPPARRARIAVRRQRGARARARRRPSARGGDQDEPERQTGDDRHHEGARSYRTRRRCDAGCVSPATINTGAADRFGASTTSRSFRPARRSSAVALLGGGEAALRGEATGRCRRSGIRGAQASTSLVRLQDGPATSSSGARSAIAAS